jgi:hypothetical protein
MAGTVIVEIRNKAFPRVSIPKDTYIVWRNEDPMPHSAETRRDASFYFTGGALLPGEASSPVYFDEPGTYPYLCRFHAGMNGTIEVTDSGPVVVEPRADHEPGHGHGADHIKHLHGFVTGGRTGRRLFMSHTPVIADPRHCYQVIIQAHFASDEDVAAYEALRAEYGPGLVQIFHQHVSMPGIGSGEVTSLPKARVAYYPGDVETDAPGLEENVHVEIDRVIHCHRFEPDTAYPDGLQYLMYGDADDVFIDHHITRAPSFHSVAKLTRPPTFWDGGESAPMRITVPGKRIRDVEPKTLPRVAFVDNAFHLVWLPPPGLIPVPQDPLIRRDGRPSVHAVRTSDGREGEIEIADAGFLWMDVRLLNYGVLIV